MTKTTEAVYQMQIEAVSTALRSPIFSLKCVASALHQVKSYTEIKSATYRVYATLDTTEKLLPFILRDKDAEKRWEELMLRLVSMTRLLTFGESYVQSIKDIGKLVGYLQDERNIEYLAQWVVDGDQHRR